MAGLYVVIDFFTHFDEFARLGERADSLSALLLKYYGVRVLAFFDRTNGILALLAAIFTLTRIRRNNEMTALMAAGISKARIFRPLFVAATAISLFACTNREVIIPRFQDCLSRNSRDWYGEKATPFRGRLDRETDIYISGKHSFVDQQRISEPNFRMSTRHQRFGKRIAATNAFYRDPKGDQPGGYLFEEVQQPENVNELNSLEIDNRIVIYAPKDTAWLQPDQCFVVSNIPFQHLQGGNSWKQFASTAELIGRLKNPGSHFSADTRVTIHHRMVRPLIDLTLLLLGMPFLLTQEIRNFFVAIGSSVLLVIAVLVVVVFCQGLGSQYLLTPAFSAWLPLIIFIPPAVALSGPLCE